MKRNYSLKGEYSIGYDTSAPSVSNYQRLLNSRQSALQNFDEGFGSPEHKMEYVKKFRGIDFINDSACCNVNGLYLTLSNIEQKITWITEFSEWGEMSDELIRMMMSKVSHVIFYKEIDAHAKALLDALNIECECCPNIESAVRAAFYASTTNQPVVFCPGKQASGIYDTYADRGNAFKNAIAQL